MERLGWLSRVAPLNSDALLLGSQACAIRFSILAAGARHPGI
jgi:hypothetical protein